MKEFENEFGLNWESIYHCREDIRQLFFAEKSLIENSEKFIQELKLELKKDIEIDETLNKESEGEYAEHEKAQCYYHYYHPREVGISQLIQNHRKGAILSIYSLIEGQLKNICTQIQKEFEFKIKLNDLNGNDYINKYWIFLTKVFCIETSNIEKYYTPIKQRKYLRNKIAHNNSIIDENKFEFVNQLEGIKINQEGNNKIIEINDYVFIENLILISQDFFENLILTINKKYSEIK
jgi:hypothetical protein